MKNNEFILSIVKKLETLKSGLIVFAYKDFNLSKTIKRWVICVSDYDFYMNDVRLKNFQKVYHTVSKVRKINIVFVYCNPKKKKLEKLAQENNLILNI